MIYLGYNKNSGIKPEERSSMIKLICDSTSYLPKELIEKYDIDIIPLSVILGPEVIVETKITNEAFFEKLDNSDSHPTSSQPTVDEISSVFEKYISAGDRIIFISISSKMSGTYSTATSVKNMLLEKYPNAGIEIIDSESNCMQMGYVVLAAAKKIADGGSFEEAANAAKNNISKSRMLFIPEHLKYLQKSGRLSKIGAIAASVLNIVPILTVTNGNADVFAKIRTRIKAKKTMLSELSFDISNNGVSDISVLHINSRAEAENLKEAVLKLIKTNVILSSIGPVIGSHVGPGTIGLVWCRK